MTTLHDPDPARRPRARLARGLLAALLLAGAAMGHAQEVDLGADLQGLLAYARARHPELAAMRQEADAANQRVGPAAALPDPMLRIELMNLNNYGSDASPSVLPWRVGETRYTLLQNLPGWGKRDLRRDVASADARQAEARTEAAWSELATRIKATYAEVLRVVGIEALTHEVHELMLRLEQVAQTRYAAGLAPQQDSIRAQLELSAMQAELIALDNDKRQLRARLNALLARDSWAPLAEPRQLRPLPTLGSGDAVALAERARDRNPQILAERARLGVAQKSRELVQLNRYPDYQVGLAPTQMRSRITSWSVMFEMNIPLQQDTRRSQEREAEAMVDAARARVEALQSQLLGELGAQLAALESARRTEALIERQLLPQSELGLRSALAAYENGKAEFALVLDAQRQIRKARQDLLKSRVEAQLRLADIERIVGEDL